MFSTSNLELETTCVHITFVSVHSCIMKLHYTSMYITICLDYVDDYANFKTIYNM